MAYVVHCKLPDNSDTAYSLIGAEDLGEALALIDEMSCDGEVTPARECKAFCLSSDDGVEFAAMRL